MVKFVILGRKERGPYPPQQLQNNPLLVQMSLDLWAILSTFSYAPGQSEMPFLHETLWHCYIPSLHDIYTVEIAVA